MAYHPLAQFDNASTDNSNSSTESLTQESESFLDTATNAALAQKGFDIRRLDLRGAGSFADYFLIVSGTSERHVKGLADKISAQMKAVGAELIGISGYEFGEWIVLDYADIVVHVFYEPTRQYFEFDKLWSKAKAIPMDPELEKMSRGLRSGRFGSSL
jgi:ribosome-associated protein